MEQWSRIRLPRQEMQVQSLGEEDPLEKEMATHSNILALEIPRTEEPGGLQSIVSQRVGYNLVTKQQQQIVGLTRKWETCIRSGLPMKRCLFVRNLV